MPLPLLHHAVYSLNLLRNPQFHAAANGDFSTVLQQRWARMASARGHRPTAAVLTSEQRKLAWVRAEWEGGEVKCLVENGCPGCIAVCRPPADQLTCTSL